VHLLPGREVLGDGDAGGQHLVVGVREGEQRGYGHQIPSVIVTADVVSTTGGNTPSDRAGP